MWLIFGTLWMSEVERAGRVQRSAGDRYTGSLSAAGWREWVVASVLATAIVTAVVMFG